MASNETLVQRRISTRPPSLAACEACRKVKMRCIRPVSQNGSIVPCDRCERNSRACNIPNPRPLGRKPGATGKYRGVEKAVRKMRSELRKAERVSSSSLAIEAFSSQDEQLDLAKSSRVDPIVSTFVEDLPSTAHASMMPLNSPSILSFRTTPKHNSCENQSQQPASTCPPPTIADQDPISNPLGLLADASGRAQALNVQSQSSAKTSPSATNLSSQQQVPPRIFSEPRELAHALLRRPGYISLGLTITSDYLEQGLEALFAPLEKSDQFSNYFKVIDQNQILDTGPDVDPVDLGLISMDDAHYLFPLYFIHLHPINGILDPELHTPEFVRSRSALLFTWILAITAQFDDSSSSYAKRLRLHGEKLSCHVHTCGFKSVEIVQGYYISLLSATPAKRFSEERSWLYTTHAFGLAAELGLDQKSQGKSQRASGGTSRITAPGGSPCERIAGHESASQFDHHELDHNSSNNEMILERLARNRERTWLRTLLWERANSAASGRMNTFPETELTLHVDTWWVHPLADSTDKYTCAFILLRRQLASLHAEIRNQNRKLHSDNHWVRSLVNKFLEPWHQSWITPPATSISSSERLSKIFLRYVYMHGRLWTLSIALHGAMSVSQEGSLIREDCFEAAVNCCEIAVRDLKEIGAPLYCMLAPTWAMISYAAVLALKLFPSLYKTQASSEVELLALLSQVALQLKKAGTTPSHRFGIAALLGEHLLIILRTRAAGLKDTIESTNIDDYGYGNVFSDQMNASDDPTSLSHLLPYDPMISSLDPFLTPPSNMEDHSSEGFAEILRDLFGQGFGGTI